MKLNTFANFAVIGLALSLVATGCHKRPEDSNRIYAGRFENPEVPAGQPLNTNNVFTSNIDTNATGFPVPPPDSFSNMVENATIFEADTVHFAFDSSAVRSNDKPKAEHVAEYLKSHAEDKVRIKGHCDERGTAEYNRSLGERRALALREVLVGLGIDPMRIDTISYGFDQPVDPAHNEAAWAKNRRGEFVLLTPPPK